MEGKRAIETWSLAFAEMVGSAVASKRGGGGGQNRLCYFELCLFPFCFSLYFSFSIRKWRERERAGRKHLFLGNVIKVSAS